MNKKRFVVVFLVVVVLTSFFVLTTTAEEQEDAYMTAMYRQDGEGSFVYWVMDGFELVEERALSGDSPSDEIAAVYCRGDGNHIIYWQVDEDGFCPYWVMDGMNLVEEGYLSWFADPDEPHSAGDWTIAAVDDITGNGEPDVIFHGREGAYIPDQTHAAYWEVDNFVGQGANLLSWQGELHDVEDWDVGAVADLDYPETKEVIWVLPIEGQRAYWRMDADFNANSAGWLLWQGAQHDVEGWTFGAIYDMDGSGVEEIIWQNPDETDGAFYAAAWIMDGYNGTAAKWIGYEGEPAGATWEIVGMHEWHVPRPQFDVFPETDIWGVGWQPNAQIKITIEGEDYYRQSDQTGHFQLQLDEEIQVVTGDQVTVDDGVTEMTHTVKYLVITAVNLGTNEVFGEAEPYAELEVGVHGAASVEVQADGQGQWSADLSAIHDIAPGDMVYVFDRDELGNATGFEWHVYVPDPRFEVYPHDNFIIGHNWPGNEELTITIEGDDYTVHTRDDGFFFRRLYTEADIQHGDEITIADVGGQVVEAHVVKYLVIEEVDYNADGVAGSAEDGSKVNVVVTCKDTGEWLSIRQVIAEDGQWEAEFSEAVGDEWWAEAFDIKPDEHNIFACIGEIIDEGDNATFHNWYEEPGVWVNPEENIINGYYFAPEVAIAVSINGIEDNVHSDVYGNFTLEGVAVEAGEYVAVDDGTEVRDYLVLGLEITDIDYEANTMSGTAPSEMMLRVNKFEYPDFILTESDEFGDWTADFSDSIYGMEGMQEIGPGCFGDVVLRDGFYATYLLWPDDYEIKLSANQVSDDDASSTVVGEFYLENGNNDSVDYHLLDDADHRFKIEGSKLLTTDYWRFDSQANPTHTIMVEASIGQHVWSDSFVIEVVGSRDIEISSTPNRDAILGRPGVASNGTDFILAWLEDDDTWRVYCGRVNASGEVLDPDGIELGVASGSHGYPSVAYDGSNYLLIWANTEIYGVRVNSDGTVIDEEPIQITNGANAKARAPSIVYDGNNYFIAWRTEGNQVKGAGVSKDGSIIDDNAGVTIGSGFYPWVAYDGTNYLVVWHRGSWGNLDIYGNRVSADDGSVLDGSGFPIHDGPGEQDHASVAFDGSNYLVVWHDNSKGGNQYNSGSAYGARVSTEGVVLDESGIEISDLCVGQVPVVVVFDGNEYMVVWTLAATHIEDTRHFDIIGQKVSVEGELLGEQIPVTIAHGCQFGPVLGCSSDQFLVAWSEGSPYERGQGVWGRLLPKNNNE